MIGRHSIVLVLEVIVAFTIIVFVVVNLIIMNDEVGSIRYSDVISDIEEIGNVSSLKSYKNGDKITIEDEIEDIILFRLNEKLHKIIIFEGFRDSKFQLCLSGSQGAECSIGQDCNFEVHVKSYNISGQQVVWLEEWYNFYDIFFGTETYLHIDFDIDIENIISDLSEKKDTENVISLKSDLAIEEIVGFTNPEKSIIKYLSVSIRPIAGSDDIDLSETTTNISLNSKSFSFSINDSLINEINVSTTSLVFYTPIEPDSDYRIIDCLRPKEFGVVILNDLDSSVLNNKILQKGDSIVLLVNLSSIEGKTIGGLSSSEILSLSIDYNKETGRKYDIITPDFFSNRLVRL